MSQPDEWEAKLGWLGSFLAGQDAQHVEIANHDSFVMVEWEGTGSARQAAKFSLEDLARPWVPYKKRSDSLSRSARLPALGKEIDRAHIDVATIQEAALGFAVTGSIGGRYENRCFPYSDLAESSAAPNAADETEELVVPTKDNSPLRHRLHL